ncbi:hypothetical protein FRX31_027443 [Thalictrum thalictroides]|uniref:Uncharacterized protein n=1 Tax=Thalictrum thalictroides TaxID=46969 RepID=A0A7J6VFH8_THATH|nr:hypothetical protein FRX31_027443 [Thalictrum thalictroides]
MFFPKRIPDFSKFMVSPVIPAKVSRMFLIVRASSIVARLKMKISSAKRRWLIGGPVLEILAPVKFPLSSFCLMRRLRTSIQMMKRRGDRGSPCLKPLVD